MNERGDNDEGSCEVDGVSNMAEIVNTIVTGTENRKEQDEAKKFHQCL